MGLYKENSMSQVQLNSNLNTIAKRRLAPITMDHLVEARADVYDAACQFWQMILANRPNRPTDQSQESTLEYTDGHLWIGLT